MEYASDAYWGDPQRYQFKASIDSFGFQTELAQDDERIVRSTFTLKINGYIIPEILQKDVTALKKFSNITKTTFTLEDEPTTPITEAPLPPVPVICAPGIVSNSGSTYIDSVNSGGTLILPNQTININSTGSGLIPSVGDIGINLTDSGSGAIITPTSTIITGRNIDIKFPTPSPVLSGIVYNFPALSGQYTSYRTGDDGWLAQNGFYDYTRPSNPLYIQELDLSLSNYYYRLKYNNIFGNKLRFTDVDGNQIFPAINNKNLVFIDHYTGLMWTRTRITNSNWDNFIDTSLTHSVIVNSVTYNDWAAPNIEIFKQLFMSTSRLIQDGANLIFNMDLNGDNKSSTTNESTTTLGYIIRTSSINNNITIVNSNKTSNDGGYFCRKHLI
jgi:hypothetical protein